jgi:hypothetical protein
MVCPLDATSRSATCSTGRVIDAVARTDGIRHVRSELPSIQAFGELRLHVANEPVVLIRGQVRVIRIVIPEGSPLPDSVRIASRRTVIGGALPKDGSGDSGTAA